MEPYRRIQQLTRVVIKSCLVLTASLKLDYKQSLVSPRDSHSSDHGSKDENEGLFVGCLLFVSRAGQFVNAMLLFSIFL